jgi:hypothetical protein
LDIVKPSTFSEIPPWKLIKLKVDISLSECKMSKTNSIAFKEKLSEIKQSKLSEISIYTNCSKDQNRVAVIKNDIFSARLPNESTINTTEAKAIQLAFEYMKTSNDKRFTVFSDRLLVLFTINQNHEH